MSKQCDNVISDDLRSEIQENLDALNRSTSNQNDIDAIIAKYSKIIDLNVCFLQQAKEQDKKRTIVDGIYVAMREIWSIPIHGDSMGRQLSDLLRTNGGLDLIIENYTLAGKELQFSLARLLEQCLTAENRTHIVANSLEKVVHIALRCLEGISVDHWRIGASILKNLLRHSEKACFDVIQLHGLDAIISKCSDYDIETLRHCAQALANLSLYGGAVNHGAMINRNVPLWLFPLAFHDNIFVQYYACMAIAILATNKEFEDDVVQSGTLDLVKSFVASHDPIELGKTHGRKLRQSQDWLQRLVPILKSHREEAQSLAAFHFCMEAEIKKGLCVTYSSNEINVIEPLTNVASKSNAVASKFAVQALCLLGQNIPRRLHMKVPLWSEEEVCEWLRLIGFDEYTKDFIESRIDGDLLLKLCDSKLRNDIGIGNSIKRERFNRELDQLKKTADYTSIDAAKISQFLKSIGSDFVVYTYPMINAGIDKEALKNLTETQLTTECRVENSIHRGKILHQIKRYVDESESKKPEDELDAFISYRRSNGSNLASLLKVHLQLNKYSVFLDVDRLKEGQFDVNLLNSIRKAKNFILVLTEGSLDRCFDDNDRKDWLHKEIFEAIQYKKNIIPVTHGFKYPKDKQLPEDMSAVLGYNAVTWNHEYQEASFEKIMEFMQKDE